MVSSVADREEFKFFFLMLQLGFRLFLLTDTSFISRWGICREGGLSNMEYIYDEACVKCGDVGSLETVSCSVGPSLQSGDATRNQPWRVPSVGQESLSNI